MAGDLRKSGIEVVGDMQWGTHFCEFYETKDDLLELLIPYFATGLENNEACIWIVSTLSEREARDALRPVVPEVERYLADQRIEIIPGSEYYLNSGALDLHRVSQSWSQKEELALERGYSGLRVSGDTAWLRRAQWREFDAYEEHLTRRPLGSADDLPV